MGRSFANCVGDVEFGSKCSLSSDLVFSGLAPKWLLHNLREGLEKFCFKTDLIVMFLCTDPLLIWHLRSFTVLSEVHCQSHPLPMVPHRSICYLTFFNHPISSHISVPLLIGLDFLKFSLHSLSHLM